MSASMSYARIHSALQIINASESTMNVVNDCNAAHTLICMSKPGIHTIDFKSPNNDVMSYVCIVFLSVQNS